MAPDDGNSKAHAAASKIAQLLGEVIVHHTPWTAEIAEKTRQRIKDEWLENLEGKGTEVIAPLVDQILGSVDPQSTVASMLEHVARPTAQFGATIQQFFIYGVMFSLASTALQPFTQVLSNELWKANPTRPLSPADVATALTQAVAFGDSQGVEIPDWATEEAAMNGVDADRFATLVGIDGQAPDGTDLFEMFRRGIITSDQLQNGFLEGPTKNKWIPFLTKLQYEPLTVSDMVRAAVQAQLPYDQANQLALQLGLEPPGWIDGNPDWFKVAYDIAGRPPGPQETARMALRGIVPWTGEGSDLTTFQQAIAESDVKTKWTDALQKLANYWPTAEETTGLYNSGGITLDQAKAYWAGSGLSSDLIAAFSHRAQVQQIEQDKALARGQIVTLLYDGIVTEDQATELLGQIGFSGQTATYIIEITLARREMRALDVAVRKVGSWYVSYKANATTTKAALEALDIPDEQITSLLGIWGIEREQPVRLPSIGELGKAVQYGGLAFDDAVARAENLGYTAFDATLIIAGASEQAPPNGYPPDTDKGINV